MQYFSFRRIVVKLFQEANRYYWYLLKPYQVVILWFNRVDYHTIPVLSGLPVIKNSGVLRLESGVTIVSGAKYNPVSGKSRTCIGVGKRASLIIGMDTKMSNCSIFAMEKITIEDRVLIGGGAAIYDSDFHSINFRDRIQVPDSNARSAPVIVRSGAFIGTEAMILKGVEIGARSVIAARSVVTRNVPPDEVWGGNPAKHIAYIEDNEP